jgi:hypothetical protein
MHPLSLDSAIVGLDTSNNACVLKVCDAPRDVAQHLHAIAIPLNTSQLTSLPLHCSVNDTAGTLD